MSNTTGTSSHDAVPAIQLGLGPNLAQFSLLVVVNAFVVGQLLTGRSLTAWGANGLSLAACGSRRSVSR
jgi:hypothetical protein